jgi:hypothetical protein
MKPSFFLKLGQFLIAESFKKANIVPKLKFSLNGRASQKMMPLGKINATWLNPIQHFLVDKES